jgi:ribonuclease HI
VLNKFCYKTKVTRIQRLINIRIAKAYRTVSNEALCIFTSIKPIHIQIEETGRYYETTKGKGNQYDREMEMENWIHLAKHVKIIEGQEDSSHDIHAYTDGSKSDTGVGAGIAIISDNSLTATLQYRLNGRCSNNQAEQMVTLKALEHIQLLKAGEKSVLVYTDSRITLQLLQNQKKHAHIIEQIRVKVIEMDQQEWKVDFSWIKAHAGNRGNEVADQLAKEAASNKDVGECYTRIPKSTVWSELNEQCKTVAK